MNSRRSLRRKTWRKISPSTISVLRRACQTRQRSRRKSGNRPKGICGRSDGNPGPVVTMPIIVACTGISRTTVAVTPDKRRFKLGAITSIGGIVIETIAPFGLLAFKALGWLQRHGPFADGQVDQR